MKSKSTGKERNRDTQQLTGRSMCLGDEAQDPHDTFPYDASHHLLLPNYLW